MCVVEYSKMTKLLDGGLDRVEEEQPRVFSQRKKSSSPTKSGPITKKSDYSGVKSKIKQNMNSIRKSQTGRSSYEQQEVTFSKASPQKGIK